MAAPKSFVVAFVAVLSLQAVIVASSPLICTEEGRLPHPTDCGRYVDCVRGDNGEMQEREGDCHGFPFSPELRRCVSHEEFPECLTKSARIAFRLPDYDYLCVDGTSKADCFHCRMAYECIGTAAYLNTCSEGDTCSDSADFGGGVCLPYSYTLSDTTNCDCSQVGIFADSYNPSYYIYCDPISAPDIVEVYTCGEGKTFSNITGGCEAASCSEEPTTPSCNGMSGTFVNPNNCGWYYTCGPSGFLKASCCGVDGQYFNETSKQCEDACTLGAGSSPTDPCAPSLTGKQIISSDCTKYALCNAGTLLRTDSCASGTYFDGTSCVVGECQSDFVYGNCPGYSDLGC